MIDVVKQLVGVGTPPVERRLSWWIENFRWRTSQAISRLQAAKITIKQFREWGHQELKDTLYGIAETGAGRKLTRKEIYRVRRILKEQIGYWDRFCEAIVAQRKALADRGLKGDELEETYNKLYAKFDRRAQSYYGAIEAEGLKWVLAQNENRWYQWTLRNAEHCIDCVERKGEVHQVKDGRLPYIPKDGSTQCLYNCMCYWKPVLKPPSGKRKKLGPMGARQRGRKLAEKHYGPGPHPSGSSQSVHGGKGAGARAAGKAPEGPDTTTEAANTFLINGLFPKRTPGIGATAGTTIWKGAPDKVREQAKDEIVTELSKRTGIVYEEVNKFVGQWARSSNDDDMRSLTIQRDAAKEFGSELSEFTKGKIDKIESQRKDLISRGVEKGSIALQSYEPLADSNEQRKLLRAMYDNTQEKLAKAGFKKDGTIRLYRGVKLPVEIAGKWNEGDVIPLKGNALQSWSSDKQVAEYFAGNWQAGGIVFEMDVPVERIVGTARTGFGCLAEGEFVIMGGAEDTGGVAYRAW